eukprot:TRINITY_DN395_c0_g2_i1.p1 TRINITY_DN395_c0_g2~~TRINITY_DN395_c0_g2_i1.p1  ORF type:complete len:332 (+),score=66.75 TRINITY_DN395_c0_g2_i1:59-1054(+)
MADYQSIEDLEIQNQKKRLDKDVRVLELLDRMGQYAPYFMEALGTFFLTLTVGCVSVAGPKKTTHPLGALAVGSVLMSCIFMGGHISGGHFNPAVSFGIWLTGRGKITTSETAIYCVSQLLGGFVAALCFWGLTGETFILQVGEGYTNTNALCAEAVFTFLLVSVVLNVATTRSNKDSHFYGLAIGFTVVAGAVSISDISGCCMNPALGISVLLVDMLNIGSKYIDPIWLYLLGPMLGALFAAIFFRITNHAKEYRTEKLGDLLRRDSSFIAPPPSSFSSSEKHVNFDTTNPTIIEADLSINNNNNNNNNINNNNNLPSSASVVVPIASNL